MNNDRKNIAMLIETTQPGERRDLETVTAIPELRLMLRDLSNILKNEDVTIIGGMLMGVYARARTTGDIDMMILSDEQLGRFAYKLLDDKFTRVTAHIFNHKDTGATVEFVTPTSVKIDPVLVQKILQTSHKDRCGLKIASLKGFIAAKLQRGIMRDDSDIVEVLKIHGPVNLSDWPLKPEQFQKLKHLSDVAEQEKRII